MNLTPDWTDLRIIGIVVWKISNQNHSFPDRSLLLAIEAANKLDNSIIN
jgi:hypothetical protein